MTDGESNPYASPQADWRGEENAALSGLAALGPHSVLVMILWSFLTLGLYINFWVHRLALAINPHLQRRNRVSMGLVWLSWALSLTALAWLVLETFREGDRSTARISDLLSRADMILTVIMAFVARGSLNGLMRVHPQHAAWFHGLWTFLFGIYYLQWKINRNIHAGDFSAEQPSAWVNPSFDFMADRE